MCPVCDQMFQKCYTKETQKGHKAKLYCVHKAEGEKQIS